MLDVVQPRNLISPEWSENVQLLKNLNKAAQEETWDSLPPALPKDVRESALPLG